MAISRITGQDATATGAATGTVAATYPAVPTQGNLLIAIMTSSGDGISFLANTGWTLGPQSASAKGVALFYKVAGNGELQAISLTPDAIGNTFNLAIYEYQGFPGIPTLDQTSGGVNASGLTSPCGTTLKTSYPNELVIAGAFVANGNTFSSWSGGFNAVTTVVDAAAPSRLFTAQQIATSTSTFTTTLTTTGAATENEGIIATFYSTGPSFYQKSLRPHPFSPGLAR